MRRSELRNQYSETKSFSRKLSVTEKQISTVKDLKIDHNDSDTAFEYGFNREVFQTLYQEKENPEDDVLNKRQRDVNSVAIR